MRRPLVLLYHGFGNRVPAQDPYHLFLPLEDLERQIRFLLRFLRPIDLSTYVEGWRLGRWPPRSFLLTIDDGYVSTLDAADLLSQLQVPGVVFVPAAALGGSSRWLEGMPDERILDDQQLRRLQELGLDVGVHAMDHRPLPGLPPAALLWQVVTSREVLSAILGANVTSFAYPEGRFDGAAVAAVRDAGYSVAFSVHEGGSANPFTVTRIPINRRDSLTTLFVKLLPGYQDLYRRSAGRHGLRRLAARVALQR